MFTDEPVSADPTGTCGRGAKYAQMWRISGDHWDGWTFPDGVRHAFDRLAQVGIVCEAGQPVGRGHAAVGLADAASGKWASQGSRG